MVVATQVATQVVMMMRKRKEQERKAAQSLGLPML